MAGADAKPQWKPKANPWLIALSVTMAAFMEVLDTTIVNVALPHIAGSLSSSNDDATWALTSYLVANGIVLPISGYLGRLLGRKRYFLICIGSFTVCSVLCGLSTSLPQLIVFRLLQGFFGGGLQPNQQSIILDTFEPSQRGKAFGVTAIATIVAPVLGPTLGGFLVDDFSWRWVFLINLPVGLICFFAVLSFVEDPPWQESFLKTGKKLNVDYVGIGFITLGLGCLQVFLDRGEDDDWTSSNFICAMMALSAIGISGAVVWLTTTANPIVNLRVLKDKNFAIGCFAIFCMAFLFVPISTIAYVTIPKTLNGDAASLYTMFRNVAGAIGISLATAMITSRTQVRMAHLSQHMTPLWQPFNDAVGQVRHKQATVLAYEDVFAVCAMMAFCIVPFTFLFSPMKSGGARGGH